MFGRMTRGTFRRFSHVLIVVLIASTSLTGCANATSDLTNQNLYRSVNMICSSNVLNFKYVPSQSSGQLARDKAAALAFSSWQQVNKREFRLMLGLTYQYEKIPASASTVHRLGVILKTWKVYVAEITSVDSKLSSMTFGLPINQTEVSIRAMLKHAGQLLTSEEREVWVPMGKLFHSC
jgi:hypothetical protein